MRKLKSRIAFVGRNASSEFILVDEFHGVISRSLRSARDAGVMDKRLALVGQERPRNVRWEKGRRIAPPWESWNLVLSRTLNGKSCLVRGFDVVLEHEALMNSHSWNDDR